MFTGLVESVGRIADAQPQGGGLTLWIEAPDLARDLAVGESVAVSGACLTVTRQDNERFEVALTAETLRATAPRWQRGARVNLERALPADGRFGGHVVTGHVEGVGTVTAREDRPDATVLRIDGPPAMARWWIPKGSVCVDGVSLTVVDVGGPEGNDRELPEHAFTLWLIPHTLRVTTLHDLRRGDAVNLESDPLARYAARAAALAVPPRPGTPHDRMERSS